MRSKEKVFFENLKFFHTFLQFNPPYHILLDASFVYSLIANGVVDVQELFKERFGGRCILYTTSCIHFRLECDFPNNDQIENIIKKVEEHPCPHSFSSSESTYNCVLGLAEKNVRKRPMGPPKCKRYVQHDFRLIIATQNVTLLEAIRNVVAVPLIYFDDNMLNLDTPNDVTLKWIQTVHLQKMEMLAMEREILEHALEYSDPVKNDVKIDTGSEKKGTNDNDKNKAHTNANKPSSQNPVEDSESQTSKRKRDVSPDICDLSPQRKPSRQPKRKLTKSADFSKYKTLCRDTVENDTTIMEETVLAKISRNPTVLLTNTSSFEFESENTRACQ